MFGRATIMLGIGPHSRSLICMLIKYVIHEVYFYDVLSSLLPVTLICKCRFRP